MKALAAVLALLVAIPVAAQDGGTDAPVVYDCVSTQERAERVDGGWFVPEERQRRVDCLLLATQDHRDKLQRQNDALQMEWHPGWKGYAVVCVVLMAASFGAAWLLKK